MARDRKASKRITIPGERRRDRRYILQMDVKWKLIRRRRVLDTGHAVTVDLSSGGILIEADRPLPSGLNLELAIAWPVKLHNTAPMQLVVQGKIARIHGRRAAVRMIQHEFRTQGTPANHRAAAALATQTQAFLAGAPRIHGLATS